MQRALCHIMESLLTFCVFVLYIIADKTSLENARTVCKNIY